MPELLDERFQLAADIIGDLDRIYASGYDQQGLTGEALVAAANQARATATDKIFAFGEDRSPTNPACMCHDRTTGGPQLHPSAPFATGPCYGKDDPAGFYPEW